MQDVQELKQSIFCGVLEFITRIYTGILIITGYSIMDILKELKIGFDFDYKNREIDLPVENRLTS
jgi:hypothetical protein